MKFSKITVFAALIAMLLFSASAFADSITLDNANQSGHLGSTFSFTGTFSGDISDGLDVNWTSISPCADASLGCVDFTPFFSTFPDTPGGFFDVFVDFGAALPGTYTGTVVLSDSINSVSDPVNFSITVDTPEPGSLALLGSGLLGLSGVIRRKLIA